MDICLSRRDGFTLDSVVTQSQRRVMATETIIQTWDKAVDLSNTDSMDPSQIDIEWHKVDESLLLPHALWTIHKWIVITEQKAPPNYDPTRWEPET